MALTLYLDESGDPNPAVAPPEYPVFVLGGVILDSEYADSVVRSALDDIKHDLFGCADFALHTAEFKRYQGPFRSLRANDPMRARLRSRILSAMQKLDYLVVACVVDKRAFGVSAVKPDALLYRFALSPLVEQFCHLIGQSGVESPSSRIVVEGRRPRDDRALIREWLDLRDHGAGSVRGQVVQRRISGLDVRSKADLFAGLELADLVVSPIGRHVIGKPDGAEWEAVQAKMHRGPDGEINGYGLILM